MVSAISTQNTPIGAISNIYSKISATPIADDIKKTASIANSFYSLSDKVEAIKTPVKTRVVAPQTITLFFNNFFAPILFTY